MGSPFAGTTAQPENGALWPLFQRELVACLDRALRPLLGERYVARVAQRVCSESSPHCCEEYIEIRQRAGDRLITLIDVVSPAGKTGDSGQFAFLTTRAQA